MLKRCCFLLFLCALFGGQTGGRMGEAFAVTLQELELRVSEGTNALAASAALEESEAQARVANPFNSLRFYGSAGYAHNLEPATAGHYGIVKYEQTFTKTGISIPLLGTWAKSRMAQLDAKARHAADKRYYEQVRNANLTALRKAWVLRWTESKKRDVLESLLKEEGKTRSHMQVRLQEHDTLPAHAETMITYFDMARQQLALSNQLETQAKTVIRQATGVTVPLSDITEPSLPQGEGMQPVPDPALLSDHPEVKNLDEAAAFLREKQPYAKWSVFDLNLDGGVAFTQDLPGAMGRSEQIGLTFSMPLNFWGTASENDRAARASLRKAQNTARLKREELRDSLEVAETAKGSAKARLDYTAQALVAARSRYFTSAKRQQELAFDSYEEVVSYRVAYTVAALEGIDSITQKLQAQVEYLDILSDMAERYAPERVKATADKTIAEVLRLSLPRGASDSASSSKKKSRHAEASGDLTVQVPVAAETRKQKQSTPSAVISSALPVRAVYVWKSSPFLDEKMDRSLSDVVASGFNTLLICFDAQQIVDLRKNGQPLKKLLRTAGKKGLRVELLLGDPGWILPQGRQGLLDIIADFSRYSFDGLHLDLEPDQLPDVEQKRGEYAAMAAETLKACIKASPWPVSFDAHPRYFDPGTDTPQLAQGLKGASFRSIYLMAYNTNDISLKGRVSGVLDAHPSLPFVLAQSYEPSENAAVSFYSQGKQKFVRHLNALPETFSQKNFSGIAVQAWEGFGK